MKTSWVDGLEADQKKEIEGLFKGALILRKRCSGIIEKKINANNTARISKGGYEHSSWAYDQADRNGYERAMTEILSLLED